MKIRARLCWWCNRRLSSVSHAIVEGRLVHKICEPEARANFKLVTAQPPQPMAVILDAGITRRELAQDLADAAEEDGYDGP